MKQKAPSLLLPRVVGFPLRGEWIAPNTPGTKVPSHGTDQLGQRFAYDFVRIDPSRPGINVFPHSTWAHLTVGVPSAECYGYGQEVYTPCAGVVIEAFDGSAERARLSLLWDLWLVITSAFTFTPTQSGLRRVLGNHVIMECAPGVYALFAHLQHGSVAVTPGQLVEQGQILGRVGHSGNSTAPHLHFQLMDNANLLEAQGVPCAFEHYEIWADERWQTVHNSIPTATDRVRFEV